MTQPLGRYTPPKRRGGFAWDWATGVMAGAIDSRNGRATAAPIPRRKVRRGSDFLAMTIFEVSLIRSPGARRHFGGGAHLKRYASHNSEDHGVEAVVLRFRVSDDGSDNRHIIMLKSPSERI